MTMFYQILLSGPQIAPDSENEQHMWVFDCRYLVFSPYLAFSGGVCVGAGGVDLDLTDKRTRRTMRKIRDMSAVSAPVGQSMPRLEPRAGGHVRPLVEWLNRFPGNWRERQSLLSCGFMANFLLVCFLENNMTWQKRKEKHMPILFWEVFIS